MKIHFIAIGGSVMHALAIALHQEGHEVSGSDDKIYDPAYSRLKNNDLLPREMGWFPEKLDQDIDAVILGMHAFEDNPELLKANELGIQVFSYPEFIYQQSQHKHRVVIAGSYGKTTVTSMIMHVLHAVGKAFDYLVGAQLDGFDNPVSLTKNAPLIIIEGDEYLASKLDKRPKALLYHPHCLAITGIAWDHVNVFPTEEEYVGQFQQMISSLSKAADLVYNEQDKTLAGLVKEIDEESRYDHKVKKAKYKSKNGVWKIDIAGEYVELKVFGKHNMANIQTAWNVCKLLSVEAAVFRKHIATYQGASLRLEKKIDTDGLLVFRDYAHAPEKVLASVEAVRETYEKAHLIACYELHTFSSLDRDFLPKYSAVLSKADSSIVFVNPAQYTRRRMEALSHEEIRAAFGDDSIELLHDSKALVQYIKGNMHPQKENVILLMSSGNLDDLNIELLKDL